MWITIEEPNVSVGRSRGFLERKCKTKVPYNKKKRQLFIPEEIVFHILMWLPANILFNSMRYVCRQWYDIVSSPQFIEQHLHHSPPSTTTTGFLFQCVYEKRPPCLINFGESNFDVTEMNFPHYDMIRASCDGLVVVNHPVAGIHVANPLTKQVICLPAFREPLINKRSRFSLVRCASKNSYKVFISYFPEFDNRILKCAIVVVGKGCSWKYFDCPDEYTLRLCKHTLSVGSIIYWSMPRSIVNSIDCTFAEASRVSLAFDVESETFFHKPYSAALEDYKENKCFMLERGKSLSLLVCLEPENVFDVWLTCNDCDPKSAFEWKKSSRIDLGFVAALEKDSNEKWHPEAWVNNGDVVIFRNGTGIFLAHSVKTGRSFKFGREHGRIPSFGGFVSGFGFSMMKLSSS